MNSNISAIVVNPNNGNSPSQGHPPKELTDLDSWLTYRLETKPDGKLNKIPTDARTGRKKDKVAFDLSYDQALNLAASSPHVQGVGLSLQPDYLLTCIDLDECRNPDTGEIEDWAWKFIRMFDSYTEASVSGTGVHIFVWGAVLGKNCPVIDGHKVELYSQDRFIAVTGNHVPDTPTDIRPAQRVLNIIAKEHPKTPTLTVTGGQGNSLDDAAVLDRARKGRRGRDGEEFARLYDLGNTSAYGGDDSRADLALVNDLAFWTGGDREQTIRLWQGSALSRDKTFREDYVRRTWDTAVSGKGPDDFYQSSLSPSLSIQGREGSLDSIPAANLEQGIQAEPFGKRGRPDPVSWIIKDLIPAGYPSTVFGAGGDGKSFLSLDLAIHVAAGADSWLGFNIAPARVLYLDFELDRNVQATRAYDLAAGMGLDAPPDNLLYLSALEMDTHTAFAKALHICQNQDVRLVVVDSIGPAMLGDAESSADVIGFMDRYIKPFRAAGVAVLMVDHQAKVIKGENAKDKLPFGSVYKTNLSRSIIQVRGKWDECVLNAQLRHVKTNFGPKQDEFEARFTFYKDKITVRPVKDGQGAFDGENVTAADKILEALRNGPQYPEDLAEITGYKLKTIQNKLSALRGKTIEYTGEHKGSSRQVRLKTEFDDGSSPDTQESFVIDLADYQ
jgi:hypothetical protein